MGYKVIVFKFNGKGGKMKGKNRTITLKLTNKKRKLVNIYGMDRFIYFYSDTGKQRGWCMSLNATFRDAPKKELYFKSIDKL